ncbi:MAG TPA: hypothetical protein VFI23_01210 [Rhizomicrobium sp.]|nr:hypothetical protein [Rhizomicrobium sp.]
MRIGILCAAAVAAAVLPAAAQDADSEDATTGVTLSSGLDFSSGKYGAGQTTDILMSLTDITLQRGDFRFSGSLPYLDIKGPDSVIAGSNGVPVAIRRGVSAIRTKRSGWGDLNLAATWSVPSEDIDDFQVDLTGRVKVATANAEKGLSSGENDFDFSVDVAREIGIWTPFVNFGYRVPGRPSAYSLVSAPSFSVGTTLQIGDQLVGQAAYEFDGTISNTLADSQQLLASLSWLCTDKLTVTTYVTRGVSAGAAQVGTGLLVSWKFR